MILSHPNHIDKFEFTSRLKFFENIISEAKHLAEYEELYSDDETEGFHGRNDEHYDELEAWNINLNNGDMRTLHSRKLVIFSELF